MKTLLYILFLSTLILSCSTESGIDVPVTDDTLVMTTVLSPHDTILAYLSNSITPYVDQEITQRTKTKVSLYENGVWVDDLKYHPMDSIFLRYYSNDSIPFYRDRKSRYVSSYRPLAGNTYTLTAEEHGFKKITGTTTLPDNSQKGSIAGIRYIGSTTLGTDNVQVSIVDHDPSDSYYMLVLYREDSIFTSDNTIRNNGIENTQLKLSSRDNIIPEQHEGMYEIDAHRYGILIKDQSFAKDTLTLLVSARHSVYSGNFSKKKSHLHFELRTVNRDFFEYWRSITLQYDTQNNPFLEPVHIYNNIENGFGNVSGYIATKKTLTINIE